MQKATKAVQNKVKNKGFYIPKASIQFRTKNTLSKTRHDPDTEETTLKHDF